MHLLVSKKREIILTFLSFLFIGCTSAPSNSPVWLSDKDSVYPKEKYISALGYAETKDAVKAEAAAEVGRYLQSEITSSIQTYSAENSDKNRFQRIETTISLTSTISIRALEYTMPYYDANTNLWYCIAYCSRQTAWNLYQPEIEQKRVAFYTIYNAIPRDNPLIAINHYNAALQAGDEFLAKLMLASVIDKQKTEFHYAKDRELIAEIPHEIISCKEKLTLFLDISTDENGILRTALSKIFSALGFRLLPTQSSSMYIAETMIQFNEQIITDIEDNIFVENPTFTLKMKNGKNHLYTYSTKAEDKIISFKQANARIKAIQEISKNINNELLRTFSEQLFSVN